MRSIGVWCWHWVPLSGWHSAHYGCHATTDPCCRLRQGRPARLGLAVQVYTVYTSIRSAVTCFAIVAAAGRSYSPRNNVYTGDRHRQSLPQWYCAPTILPAGQSFILHYRWWQWRRIPPHSTGRPQVKQVVNICNYYGVTANFLYYNVQRCTSHYHVSSHSQCFLSASAVSSAGQQSSGNPGLSHTLLHF